MKCFTLNQPSFQHSPPICFVNGSYVIPMETGDLEKVIMKALFEAQASMSTVTSISKFRIQSSCSSRAISWIRKVAATAAFRLGRKVGASTFRGAGMVALVLSQDNSSG